MQKQHLMLGAGCFWGVEHHFLKLTGVLAAPVGYAGGHTEHPTYEEVCRKDTQHAEVVNIEFDAEVISRQQLLEDFFKMHDPTTLNRQGPDIGSQYRSVIFVASEEEKRLAQKVMTEAQTDYAQPIVTTLEPLAPFWRAEEYHQQYFIKRGIDRGCH